MSHNHSEETRATVRRMIGDNASYSMAAAAVGITRSAAASLIRRMGLVKNTAGPRGVVTPEALLAKAEAKSVQDRLHQKRESDKAKAITVYPFTPRDAVLPEAPKNLSFVEMDFRSLCAFPTHAADQNATYCGHNKRKESSYCEGHHELTHQSRR